MNDHVSSFDNFVPQNFPYPKPIILYALDNTGSCLLKKLHKSCKYFFIKRNVTIIDKFTVETLDDQKLNVSGYDINASFLKIKCLKNNLWITDKLVLSVQLKEIVSKIIKSDIKVLDLQGELTVNEFKKLTAAGNIEKLSLFKSIIYFSDDTPLAFDQILLLVPKAFKFNVLPAFTNMNTNKNLLSLEHRVKISVICLNKMREGIEADSINKFLLKNLDDEAALEITFLEKENGIIFADELYDKIKSWTPSKRKPKYFHLCHIDSLPAWPEGLTR